MKSNNRQNPQKTIDRMRKKNTINKGGTKICLVILIQNQPNTIYNLLNSLKSIVDMISIIDLSNNPNNDIIKSISDWSTNNSNIPIKISNDQYKNLSYNKTNSIKISKKEFSNADYFLLSELDFIWDTNNFDKNSLVEEKYDVIQNMNYHQSTRLLSAKINWLCHLNSYEYWTDINNKINNKGNLLPSLSINNNDNKEEKISLLYEDLNTPNISKYDKSRIKFYLGCLLKEVDMFEEAINFSNERINEGGCKEEIYYAIYNIGLSYEKWGWKIKKCIKYINLTDKTDDDIKFIEKWDSKNLEVNDLLTESAKLFNLAIYNYKKAYDFRPSRSESLYNTAKLYRRLKVNEIYILAYQTIMIANKVKYPTDYLFVNKPCYDYLLDFELMMIAYLIPDKKIEGKTALIRLLKTPNLPNKIKENIKTKMKYYV